MEHRTLLGGLQHLPLARSRIRALQAASLTHASERLLLPDGIVTVRIIPGHEFIRLEGRGFQAYSTGIVGNRITVRHKTTDGNGNWRAHSAFDHAFSDPEFDRPQSVKLNDKRYSVLSAARSADTVGSDSSSTRYRFVDSFGKNKPIFAGPEAPYLAGIHWGFFAWMISTDGATQAGTYLFSAVDLTGAGLGDFRNIIWKCEHIAWESGALTAKPTMWAFTYDPGTHGGRQLHTLLTENVVYVGLGYFVYGIGGSSYNNGTRDADHKMSIVVADEFETFTAYDVETGLGAVYGPDDFALGGCCSIGGTKVLFGGYGTDNMIAFNTTGGTMTLVTTSDVGWSTTKANPSSMGTDSACYWRYTGASALRTNLQLVTTTDAGVTWTARPIVAKESDGTTPVTVDFYVPYTTVRKPVTKDGATITSNGILATVFHISGVGHCEFQSTDLGATWVKKGIISSAAASSLTSLLFRSVHYGAPDLSLTWGG